MWIISVSKTYKHRGRNIRHRPNTKKFWQIMYYDYDEEWNLKLYSKFVNWLEAMYYKTQKRRKLLSMCPNCNELGLYFVRSKYDRLRCTDCDEIYYQ